MRMPDGAAIEEIAWGVKQTQAESDVVLKAAARYAAPSSRQLVAASSSEAWMQIALAAAIVDSTLFAAAQTRTVTLESLDDAEVHFLARIARLYSSERPAITLTSVAGLPAFVAEAHTGPFRARAISASGVEAICNALGQACSQMQLAETGREPEPLIVAVRTPLDPPLGGVTRAQSASSAGCIDLLARAGLSARRIMQANAAFVAAGIHVGAIELTPIGASP